MRGDKMVLTQIAVTDTLAVHVRNRRQYRRHDPRRLRFRVRVAGIQIASRTQFHDDEDLIPVFVRFHRSNDVRVIDGTQDTDLVT